MDLKYYYVKCSKGFYYDFCKSCLVDSFSFDCLTTDFKIANDCKLCLDSFGSKSFVLSFGTLPRLSDFYTRCKDIDALTWLDVADSYRKRNRELYSILEKIAKKLGVYNDGSCILDFVHDNDNNVIFKELGIGG